MDFQNEFYIIPSVREIKHLSYALTTEAPYIHLSNTHIGNLKPMVDAVHQAGKKTVVNVELIGGFNLDRDGARFLKQIFHVDVVIVSNPMWTNYLKGLNLFVIQRIMLMDSLALENSLRIVSETSCDAVELRPSVYGIKYINRLRQTRGDIPYFLAGFINAQKIIDEARMLQFKAVTLSNNKLWNYKTK